MYGSQSQIYVLPDSLQKKKNFFLLTSDPDNSPRIIISILSAKIFTFIKSPNPLLLKFKCIYRLPGGLVKNADSDSVGLQ